MIQKIKDTVHKLVKAVWSKMEAADEKKFIYTGIAMVIAGITISCAVLYFYICALAYVGGLLGIGNYFLLAVCVLTFCFTVNGRNYAVIQDDDRRSFVGGIIFVTTMVIYLVF